MEYIRKNCLPQLGNYLLYLSLIFFTSCGVYRQNAVNVPIITNKGQAQVGGYISLNGLEGQLSYALTQHMALIANYQNLGTRTTVHSSSNKETTKHYFGEGGIGYYKKTPAERYFDIMAIGGQGMTSHAYQGLDQSNNTITHYREAYYNRFCLQSDFGKISNNHLLYAFTPRLLMVNYFNVSDTEVKSYQGLPDLYLYSDFSFTIRYRVMKYLSISGQTSFTLPITGYDAAYFEFSPFSANLGLIFNLHFGKQAQE